MASGDLTKTRMKRALFFIPALAILGALSWPAGYGRPGPTTAMADCIDPLGLICSTPSPTATATPPKASPTPSHSPSPHPTATHSQPPSTSPTTPSTPGADSGGAIGAAPGPPAPPRVLPASIAVTSEPADPQPGSVATLIITVSGQNGADRYGVSGVGLTVTLKQKPAPDAALDATSVFTDASGAATVKLTMSQTRGRHVVDAVAGSVTAEWTADTLAGANQLSRARHGGEIDTITPATRGNAPLFFVAAAVIFVLGFAWPSVFRWLSRRGLGVGGLVPSRAGLRTSSKRTS
ncbi:MAG TPA: hypothetical protein VNV65_02985 [Candidatus Solibacter sp.]|jgi:hypothetical protein|nr:hypothetical protein [Candidatus Solibacter sp.]